jgi:hypothetical protein
VKQYLKVNIVNQSKMSFASEETGRNADKKIEKTIKLQLEKRRGIAESGKRSSSTNWRNWKTTRWTRRNNTLLRHAAKTSMGVDSGKVTGRHLQS